MIACRRVGLPNDARSPLALDGLTPGAIEKRKMIIDRSKHISRGFAR
jgi:hypothetical protein